MHIKTLKYYLMGSIDGEYMKKSGLNKGFSLVEILVVIALMSVITIIGVPAIISQISHMKLTRGVRDISSELNAARMKAISQNIPYRVEFNLDFSGTVDRYSLSYWNGASWTDDPERAAFDLDPKVNITSPGADFEVAFYANGSASATNICVVNTSKTDDRMRISVQGSTGMIIITTTAC